jgi:cytochrome-b5 reductase
VCHFSTAGGPTKPSSSNLPFYLGGVGLTGLAAYLYLGGSPAPFTTKAKPKQEKKSALDPERFLDLKLKSIEPYNHNTSRFTFELPNGGAALSPITSLVIVRASEGEGSQHANAPVDKKGNLAMRAYTPISSPDHEGELVLLIKKYENGVISKYVHERLKPGDTLSIKGPIPKFPYKGTFAPLNYSPSHTPPSLFPINQTIIKKNSATRSPRSLPFLVFSFFLFSHANRPRWPFGRPSIVANEFEDVALIGGGSGITPLYQLIHHALNDPTNRTRFTLLYANVTEADILLRDELAALQRAHPATFKIVHSLDKPPVSGWSGASGYVSRELVQAHVPPAEKGDKVKVLICGTSSLHPHLPVYSTPG